LSKHKNKAKKNKKIIITPKAIIPINCKVIVRNIEWEPQSDEVYPYIPSVEQICNIEESCKESEYIDKYESSIETKEKEGYDDWKDVWIEHVNVRLNKPPQGEAKDKTPGAKAKPNPWDLPDKGFGDVYDRRTGVWVGGRDKYDPPIKDQRGEKWYEESKVKDKI
jgi:hypothetical protein